MLVNWLQIHVFIVTLIVIFNICCRNSFPIKMMPLCFCLAHIQRKGHTIWFLVRFIGLSKERPYLVLALNLILSQISSFTHIYGFADFNGFVDLWILADFQI